MNKLTGLQVIYSDDEPIEIRMECGSTRSNASTWEPVLWPLLAVSFAIAIAIAIASPCMAKDSSSNQLKPYLDKVQSHIEHNWYPAKGQERKTIETVFKIHRDGSISDLGIRHSNGSRLENDCAIDAVKNSAPFEKLPSTVGREIGLKFVFSDEAIVRVGHALTVYDFAKNAEKRNGARMPKTSAKTSGQYTPHDHHHDPDSYVGDFWPPRHHYGNDP